MPIYEFKCADCGHVGELLVGIGRNSDELICASCGGSILERQMSAAAFSIPQASGGPTAGGSCCGGTPSSRGCVPGSCCGSN